MVPIAASAVSTQQPASVLLQPAKNTSTTANAAAAASSYQLVMDPRLGVIVGTMTPAGSGNTITTTQLPQTPQTPKVSVAKPASAVTTIQTRRRRGRNSTPPNITQTTATVATTPSPVLQQQQKQTRQVKSVVNSPAVNVRATESTVIGGLSNAKSVANNNVVDLTSEEVKTTADTKEVSFNKLQGKTFPSLVVVARPHLRVKDSAGGDRSRLDAKVKAVLMHPPTKFTEW